jgi:hypothetical protein
VNDNMELEKDVRALFDACVRMNRHHPPELLRWFVADVLAGFGVESGEKAPEHLTGWLREQGGEYARLVERRPFEDLLGTLYQMLGSHGHRAHLGQFFTPQPVADLMAALADPVPILDEGDPASQGRLLRMCEPACGSGALVLGFLRRLLAERGREGPRRWSITAIDLDPLCARICATQVLANAFVGQIELGEVVVYSGNALAPWECLQVVVHASSRDLRPDVVLPALHPSRLEALRQATRGALPAAGSTVAQRSGAVEQRKPDARAAWQPQARPTEPATSQVDLFAE